MLQQTQVATVIPYFLKWMQRFPDVFALAVASEDEVLAIWQGLGYYSRCRQLHAGAKQIAAQGFPTSSEGWRAVPGVGPYTAGAVASIAFGAPVPVVDGNIERVFARVAACEASGAELKRRAWTWAENCVDRESPGDWNQALMELGATVCTPRAPRCDACPITQQCLAHRDGKQDMLPVRVEAIPSISLTAHCWIPVCGNRFGVRQIPEGAWWQGMWEFPRESEEGALRARWPTANPSVVGNFMHAVTKHRIRVTVSVMLAERAHDDLRWLENSELEQLPMPSPARKALELARRRSALLDIQ